MRPREDASSSDQLYPIHRLSRNPTLGAVVDLPLLEDDLDSREFIEPRNVVDRTDMPSRVVFCFFTEMLDKIATREGRSTTPHRPA